MRLSYLLALGCVAAALTACTSKPEPQTFTTISIRVEGDETGVRQVIEKRIQAAGLNAKVVKDRIEVIGALTGEQITALTAQGKLQFRKVLDSGPCEQPALAKDATEKMSACDKEKSVQYQLDVAKVTTADVQSAKAEQNADGTFVVLTFTGEGQKRWTELTREAVNNSGGGCAATSLGRQNHCLVAIVLDGVVISAPEILGVVTSDAYISGGLSLHAAKALAAQISGGELPAKVTVTEIADCASGRGCRRQ